jgi:hypothetical protein
MMPSLSRLCVRPSRAIVIAARSVLALAEHRSDQIDERTQGSKPDQRLRRQREACRLRPQHPRWDLEATSCRPRYGDRTITVPGAADHVQFPSVKRMEGIVNGNLRTQGIVTDGGSIFTSTVWCRAAGSRSTKVPGSACPKARRNAAAPFLFPVKALSEVFRGKYIAALKRARDQGELRLVGHSAELADPAPWQELLDALAETDWVVYCKRPFGSPVQVLKYLSRYTHTGWLSPTTACCSSATAWCALPTGTTPTTIACKPPTPRPSSVRTVVGRCGSSRSFRLPAAIPWRQLRLHLTRHENGCLPRLPLGVLCAGDTAGRQWCIGSPCFATQIAAARLRAGVFAPPAPARHATGAPGQPTLVRPFHLPPTPQTP